MDSGASKHFTHELSDFAEYKLFDGPVLTTTVKKAPLQIKGEGTLFLTHEVSRPNRQKHRVITHLYPATMFQAYRPNFCLWMIWLYYVCQC